MSHSVDKAIITVDYPYPEIYYAEDTEWGIHPNESGDPHDPGMLVAKPGARPVQDKLVISS